MLKPPWREMLVPHCHLCSDFMLNYTDPDVPIKTKSFLGQLWYEHEDSADDMRCWNAYQSIFDPSEMVDLEKMEADSNAAVVAAERAEYEKLKEKFEK